MRRKTKTAHYVIQECHRTHGVRVRSHDRIIGILGDELKKKYKILQDQRFVTAKGLMKPDLLLMKGDTGHVLDVQVVKGSGLNDSHARNVGKYQSDAIELHIKNRHNVQKIDYYACTLSYKGIWCQQSVTDLFKIVTSTLRGTWLCW